MADIDPVKIPDRELLRISRREVGALKSYIQELEHNIGVLKQELVQSKSMTKSEKIEARRTELYELKKKEIASLSKTIHSLRTDKDDLIIQLVQAREELKQLKG